jgi:hypothetical protein
LKVEDSSLLHNRGLSASLKLICYIWSFGLYTGLFFCYQSTAYDFFINRIWILKTFAGYIRKFKFKFAGYFGRRWICIFFTNISEIFFYCFSVPGNISLIKLNNLKLTLRKSKIWNGTSVEKILQLFLSKLLSRKYRILKTNLNCIKTYLPYS